MPEPSNPFKIGADAATRDQTRRALQALPTRQRTAIVLRYFEDLSEQETADAMGASVPAVKSLVQRAMKAMRQELDGGRYE